MHSAQFAEWHAGRAQGPVAMPAELDPGEVAALLPRGVTRWERLRTPLGMHFPRVQSLRLMPCRESHAHEKSSNVNKMFSKIFLKSVQTFQK